MNTRTGMRRRVLRIAAASLGVASLGFGVYTVRVMLPRATGYAAKIACSAAYIRRRPPAQIREQELASVGFVATPADELRPEPDTQASAQPWPLGDAPERRPDPPDLDRPAVDAAVDAAFMSPPGAADPRTRAVLVAYDGQLVAERYAEGFDAHTPLPGWSMAKSVTNALVGVLVGRGLLELDAPAPVPEWRREPADPRAAITLSQLLRMSSGLAFEERYGPFGAGSDMLFVDDSSAALAVAQEPSPSPSGPAPAPTSRSRRTASARSTRRARRTAIARSRRPYCTRAR